jgi:hypothetical protein
MAAWDLATSAEAILVWNSGERVRLLFAAVVTNDATKLTRRLFVVDLGPEGAFRGASSARQRPRCVDGGLASDVGHAAFNGHRRIVAVRPPTVAGSPNRFGMPSLVQNCKESWV